MTMIDLVYLVRLHEQARHCDAEGKRVVDPIPAYMLQPAAGQPAAGTRGTGEDATLHGIQSGRDRSTALKAQL